MKKILTVLCFFAIGMNCNALELYPYQSPQTQSIGGSVKTNGGTDYIKMPSKDNYDFLDDLLNPQVLISTLASGGQNVSDPYIVPVDGVNYVMVKDKNTTNWSEQDLLGINDPKDNMFLSLRGLESDGNASKITAAELKKAGIRLVRLNNDGTLLVNDRKKDLDLNRIDYIDMANIRKTANSEATGIFGHFNVFLKTNDPYKRMTVGYVTFDTHSNLKILFK